jgi:hypothetical protein
MKYWAPTASDMPPTQFEDLSHCTKHSINAPYLGLINNALDALHKNKKSRTLIKDCTFHVTRALMQLQNYTYG